MLCLCYWIAHYLTVVRVQLDSHRQETVDQYSSAGKVIFSEIVVCDLDL